MSHVKNQVVKCFWKHHQHTKNWSRAITGAMFWVRARWKKRKSENIQGLNPRGPYLRENVIWPGKLGKTWHPLGHHAYLLSLLYLGGKGTVIFSCMDKSLNISFLFWLLLPLGGQLWVLLVWNPRFWEGHSIILSVIKLHYILVLIWLIVCS